MTTKIDQKEERPIVVRRPVTLWFLSKLYLFLTTFLCLVQVGVAQHYQQTNLVSDIPGLATTTDSNLVNSWGIAHSGGSPWWVADNGTGVSTLYNGAGQAQALVVTIPGIGGPATPTGIVFNGSADFEVASGKPAAFIFVTEDGTISGWNPGVDLHNAIQKFPTSGSSGGVYKGTTIASDGFANHLYVTNFHGRSVDVFDRTFTPVASPPGAFTDPELPAGYAPFNIQNINGTLYVTFAKHADEGEDEVHGPGLGFVDAFDAKGTLLMRLKSGRWFNAPWGITMAPNDFGKFSNHLLVGNFGSGRIAAFNPNTGNFQGLLRGPIGMPIAIEGLWGIGFGNGANAGPTNTLFFAAGIDDENHGLFGTLTPIIKNDKNGDEGDTEDNNGNGNEKSNKGKKGED